MIAIDCFTFCDELDLLELRLNILSDVVDAFVLVEAGETFQGDAKPFHYQDNARRFAAFNERIWPVRLNALPHGTTWAREHYQRNAIIRGLRAYGARSEDMVLVSDVDEIPHPDAVRELHAFAALNHGYTIAFRQTLYTYHLNWRHVRPWYGTRAVRYGDLREPQNLRATLGPLYRDEPVIEQGGWSFSSFGGADAVVRKLKSFSHSACAAPEYANEAHVSACIANGTGIMPDDGNSYVWSEVDDTYPAYLRDNLERYAGWLGERNVVDV